MQGVFGEKVLSRVRAAISPGRHARGMGRIDIEATGGRAEKKGNQADQADLGPNVERLEDSDVAGVAELHALKPDNFLFAGDLAAWLQQGLASQITAQNILGGGFLELRRTRTGDALVEADEFPDGVFDQLGYRQPLGLRVVDDVVLLFARNPDGQVVQPVQVFGSLGFSHGPQSG